MTPAETITLSLVSHTNVGKTTLARTLLMQDVGEVRDAPHVTEFAAGHPLLRSAAGDELRLWDTPGFGDSARLAKRMRQSSQPLGWVLTQVWDRFTDRPFWASQQALRHVREQTDVVLYLVNAAESPAAAAYVASEMELLQWLGKPVLVLLNQMGAPREAAAEGAELEAWRSHLARWPLVAAVLPLDAFARCWVQELTLWRAVEAALPAPRQAAMARLRQAWQAQALGRFDQAMAVLEETMRLAQDWREPVAGGAGLRERLRELAGSLKLGAAPPGAVVLAQQALAERIGREVQAATAQLIALHGLQGAAQGMILERLAPLTRVQERVDEGKAAWLGGLVTGALAGLKADIATGGLTLGGGALAGGIIGALGAAGVARGVNLVRGTEHSSVSLNDQGLLELRQALLLRYLAVAHFGRGRGDWVQGEAPAHWLALVVQASATPALRSAALELLEQLYPGHGAAVHMTP